MIKAIFFDLDDTLLWDERSIKEAFRQTTKFAQTKYDVDPLEFEKVVREEAISLYSSYETYEFTKMIGINPFEGLWGNFLDDEENFKKLSNIVPKYRQDAWTRGLKKLGIVDVEFGISLSEKFREVRRNNPFVYEDVYHVLDKLKGDYHLLLLTNGSPELQNTKLSITPDLAPYFDEIVISGDFGRGKPDPSLFKYALSLLNLKNNEAIMVGDNLLTDILGASRANIKSVWINRHNKPIQDITPTYEINSLEQLFPVLRREL